MMWNLLVIHMLRSSPVITHFEKWRTLKKKFSVRWLCPKFNGRWKKNSKCVFFQSALPSLKIHFMCCYLRLYLIFLSNSPNYLLWRIKIPTLYSIFIHVIKLSCCRSTYFKKDKMTSMTRMVFIPCLKFNHEKCEFYICI